MYTFERKLDLIVKDEKRFELWSKGKKGPDGFLGVFPGRSEQEAIDEYCQIYGHHNHSTIRAELAW